MSVLSPQEAKTFFRNWLGLMAFVNDKYNLIEGFGHPKSPLGISPETVNKIKAELWKNAGIIDEYIDSVWDLPRNDIQILKGWKNGIAETFTVVRHLKRYSVFLNEKSDLLYGVIGISGPISEIIPSYMLPTIVKTVLLPFEDRIIYDSILGMSNIQFGSNIRRELKELYSEIKEKKGIISTLNGNTGEE